MRPLHAHQPQIARATRGFTLIEIMIVVALIGILASIALSSYQSHALKTRRYAAQSCLMEQAQYMERYYTTANNPMSYTGAVLPAATCQTNLASYYAFSLISASQAFTVQAVASGTQTSDTNCRTLALNQAALQSSSSATASTTGCWP
ncbi:MAG: type IV pilin protein [Betaproteobacteria bacterium]|nr:type IV pilin protein [Betaproteobacteria bacterium]